MVTVSSPSPTSWHSFALPFPSSGTSSSRGGEADQRYTWQRHPAGNNSCECDHTRQISTQGQKS
jgi:hypothetical protein